MSKIIVIVGPTGVGKTKISILLAKLYNAEIINADSVQIFKEFNIATSKIKEEEKENIKHHLISIKNPNELYSVADYQKDGRNILDKLISKNKNIIIVGGSGLYIKALLYDYKFIKNNKEKVNNYEFLTNKELKDKVDKIYSNNNIHINNRKRLIRFINEYENNNHIIKNEENKNKLLYDNVVFIGLTTTRINLHNLINNRVDEMFKNGIIEESKMLYNKKITKCLSIIGYKELFNYFDNKITKDKAIEQIKTNTRRYAKRQYTWFKNQMDIKWFDVDYNNINNTIEQINKYIIKKTY